MQFEDNIFLNQHMSLNSGTHTNGLKVTVPASFRGKRNAKWITSYGTKSLTAKLHTFLVFLP